MLQTQVYHIHSGISNIFLIWTKNTLTWSKFIKSHLRSLFVMDFFIGEVNFMLYYFIYKKNKKGLFENKLK